MAAATSSARRNGPEPPAQRHLGADALGHGPSLLGRHAGAGEEVGLDRAGAHRVDPDPATGELRRRHAHRAACRALAGRVGAGAGHAEVVHDAGVQDDGSTLGQLLHQGVQVQDRSGDVERELPRDELGVDLPEGRELPRTGVQEQRVHAPVQVLAHRLGQRGTARGVAGVVGQGRDALEQVGLLQALGVGAGHEHARALRREELGGGEADAAGATGDDGMTVGEAAHGVPSRGRAPARCRARPPLQPH